MANKKHVALLKQGVEAWNQLRRENPNARSNLSRANLHKARLRDADLSDMGLSHPRARARVTHGGLLVGAQ